MLDGIGSADMSFRVGRVGQRRPSPVIAGPTAGAIDSRRGGAERLPVPSFRVRRCRPGPAGTSGKACRHRAGS